MIYIKCRRGSRGADALVSALEANGHPAQRWRDAIPDLAPTDLVVSWGEPWEHMDDGGAGAVLNPSPLRNKLLELEVLKDAEIPVPPFSVTPRLGWHTRSRHHQQARDLLRGQLVGDYYVEIVPTTCEFRVHVWRDAQRPTDFVVARLGLKVPGPGDFHPVYRSHDAGWVLNYGEPAQAAARTCGDVRGVARAAVAACGLDFGAVDVGVVAGTNNPIVFEVNTAPGLEGGTVAAYARHVAAWAEVVAG